MESIYRQLRIVRLVSLKDLLAEPRGLIDLEKPAANDLAVLSISHLVRDHATAIRAYDFHEIGVEASR
jgi:hypothetical protein